MKKKARILSFILAFVMLVPLFTVYGFALEEDSEASSSDSATTESASVTWEDVIAGMATPDEYYEANGTSDLSAELGSEASTTSVTYSIGNGVYYINNKYTGKYMYYSSSVSTKSGLISDLGDNIRWSVTETSNGYVIRSSADTTKYLAVSTSTTSEVVIVTSSSLSSVPDTCYWDFILASGGGVLIKSLYNSKYLYSTSTALFTASSTGTSGTETYYSRVWRFVTKSNMNSKELTSFSVGDCSVLAGNSVTPAINPTPSNAFWTDAYDFTYSGYSTSYFTLNSLTGKFTGISSVTGVHYSRVTATHKVTGLTATFYLVINPRALLVGIPSTADSHNHTGWIDDADNILTGMGYTASLEKPNTFSSSQTLLSLMDGYLNCIFAVRCHGGCNSTHTWLLLTDTESTKVRLYSDDITSSYDLSNMKLMLFVSCKSGYGGVDGNNLPTAAVENGATTAIGFEETISCIISNTWTIDFFTYMAQGKTVNSTCSTLAGLDTYSATSMTSYVICGQKTTKLT